MSPLEMFWNDAKPSIFCDKMEFERMMTGVTFYPWGDDGALALLGNEVHTVGIRRGWLTRLAIRQVFVPLLRERGVLTTRIARNNSNGHRFVERIGFKKCGENKLDYLYRIERSNYE